MTIQDAAEAAKRCEAKTGVPAAVVIAQWGIETGWGEDAPGNNCLGIKQYPGCFGRQLLNTTEWFTEAELKAFLSGDPARTALQSQDLPRKDSRRKYRVKDWFATFPTLEACFEKWCQLFQRPRYKPFLDAYLTDADLEKFIRGFTKVYATAPNYADVVLKIISQPNVQTALNKSVT